MSREHEKYVREWVEVVLRRVTVVGSGRLNKSKVELSFSSNVPYHSNETTELFIHYMQYITTFYPSDQMTPRAVCFSLLPCAPVPGKS